MKGRLNKLFVLCVCIIVAIKPAFCQPDIVKADSSTILKQLEIIKKSTSISGITKMGYLLKLLSATNQPRTPAKKHFSRSYFL